MSRLFPLRTPIERDDAEPRVVDIADDEADAVVAALSAETGRALLEAVYEEPRPASELAEAVDTSLQNARYHLDKLVAADLVEVADTWYSERGSEMAVYAPTNGPVAVVVGDEEERSVREALRGALAALGVLAATSAAVQWLAAPTGDGDVGGGEIGTAAADSGGTGPVASLVAEPGVLFFAGGLAVLTALWLWAARRHPA